MHAQDDMKLPSLPSLGLPLPLDEDDLPLEDDDLLAEEAEAPASPGLQGPMGLPPVEHPAQTSCAAAEPAPCASISAMPEPEAPAAQVDSILSACHRAIPSHSGLISLCAPTPLPALQAQTVPYSENCPEPIQRHSDGR